MVPLANIMLSEVIFGGVGAGMYGILIYIVLAVFIAGLMVGRTPEYLGKKIESYDVKMAMLVAARLSADILMLRSDFHGDQAFGTSTSNNPGPAWTVRDSLRLHFRRGNNGSAFARISPQYALVQHDHRHDHAGRPLLHDHPDAGDRRQPGAEEVRAAIAGHVPRHNAAVHVLAD